MNVHIFGKKDSPCITNFSLKQWAKDQQDEFSKVITESVDKDFYIYDFLKSGECVKDFINYYSYYSYYPVKVSDWQNGSQIVKLF